MKLMRSASSLRVMKSPYFATVAETSVTAACVALRVGIERLPVNAVKAVVVGVKLSMLLQVTVNVPLWELIVPGLEPSMWIQRGFTLRNNCC